eukprot:CAMPEP_0204532752 /NCGR_PEP_ID=MMETSP0661-20131031/11896_1 /ASSEMBLY_ACC=CAM_ASM_000606 /TAXON_ID=109239 /ORGANISM="Alexandrium margalefi, Strain AMGDE01CS-322" /LENGTH=189 /DNA_ID=CAMNT_0051539021 /DNA_START=92 /DNA_END=658 /DNA_ORIENTATION=-
MARAFALALLALLPEASTAFVQSPATPEVPQRIPPATRFLSPAFEEPARAEVGEPEAQPQSWLASFASFGIALGLVAGLLLPAPSRALTAEQYSQLTYNQVKGSGLANRCPTVESRGGSVPVGSNAKITNLCFEPKSWAVEAETDKGTEFVTTKLLTRQTYTLAFINGDLSANPITFREDDGIHTLPTT